jgi:hypothetical protein
MSIIYPFTIKPGIIGTNSYRGTITCTITNANLPTAGYYTLFIQTQQEIPRFGTLYFGYGPTILDFGGNFSTNRPGGALALYITRGTSSSYNSANLVATCDSNSGSNIISNICFPGNTPIKVDQGIFAINNLQENIHSINSKPIKKITKTKTNENSLICIEKNALAINIPSQKTILSGNHKIMYKGKLVKSKHLIDLLVENVYKIKYNGEYLYNVLLEKHGTMIVNNMICETLSPKNTIVQLYNILDKIPLECHKDIIIKFNKKNTNKNWSFNFL